MRERFLRGRWLLLAAVTISGCGGSLGSVQGTGPAPSFGPAPIIEPPAPMPGEGQSGTVALPNGGTVTFSNVVVKPEVVVLPADGSVRLTNVTDNSVTLIGSVPPLQPGSAIVSGEGQGLLRRVKAAIPTEGGVIATTESAALVDVFQSAKVRLSKPMTASDWASVESPLPGVTSRVISDRRQAEEGVSLEAAFNNAVLSVNLPGGLQVSGTIDGTARIGADIDFAFEISAGGVDLVRFAPILSETPT